MDQDVYSFTIGTLPATDEDADAGFALLNLVLPIMIALATLIFVLLTTHNLVYAMIGSVIGLLTFYIVKTLLATIS